MNTFVKPGKTVTLTAPTGGVTAGYGYKIGQLFVVAVSTVAAGSPFEGMVEGVFTLVKTTSQAWSEGDALYWDIANSKLTTSNVAGPRVGACSSAAGSSDATGQVRLDGVSLNDDEVVEGSGTPTSLATAGNATYTIAQLLTGIIVRDPAGADRTDVLPTAALVVAGIPGCKVGDLVRCKLINGADAAETITLSAGSGGGWDSLQPAETRIVPRDGSKELILRVTNVTASSEAYVAYL